MQKIIIKYLGSVRELEMEIKDFNLLIGEQEKALWQKRSTFLEL